MTRAVRCHAAGSAVLSAVLSVVLTGCAPGPTVVVEPGGLARLAEIQALQVGLAEVTTAATGADTVVDILPELSERLDGSLRKISVAPRPRGASLADSRDGATVDTEASATLLYRRADSLEGYQRPQSTERWYWWAILRDHDDRILATLHGEREKSRGEPEEQLARELKRLFKRARSDHR